MQNQGNRTLHALLPLLTLLFLAAAPAHATFMVVGTGKTFNSGSTGLSNWVASEDVTLSFNYEIDDFGTDSFTGNPDVAFYNLANPIVLDAEGSTSGQLLGVGSVFRSVFWRLTEFGYDLFSFDVSFENFSTAAFRSRDRSFSVQPGVPSDFSQLHSSVFPGILDEMLWVDNSTIGLQTAADRLVLRNFNWTIRDLANDPVNVASPATLTLMPIGALMILLVQARRRPSSRLMTD